MSDFQVLNLLNKRLNYHFEHFLETDKLSTNFKSKKVEISYSLSLALENDFRFFLAISFSIANFFYYLLRNIFENVAMLLAKK